jgi:tetratricopeptide (TPR) repeat protein
MVQPSQASLPLATDFESAQNDVQPQYLVLSTHTSPGRLISLCSSGACDVYCTTTWPQISFPRPDREANGPREGPSPLEPRDKYHLTSSLKRGHRAPKEGRSMSKRAPTSPDPARPLPERANLEHLKKEAKQRLKAMRLDNPGVKLSAVQLTIAREYGLSSWRSLIAYVKSQTDKEAQLPDQRRASRARPFAVQALRDGVEAVGKGDYQTAVAHFRQAETAHPAVTLSLVQHGVTKEFGESVWRDLLAYIKSLPDEAQLRPTDSDLSPAYDDGLEAVGKGDYRTAVAHLRRAIRERLLRIRAHYYLGRALFRLQLYREALTAFEELLKFDPENLLAHYEIGKLHLYAQNYPPELLSQFDPENLLANYEIGNRYLSPQNYADAITKYQWLRSQSENSIGDLDDSTYDLLPDEPRGGNLMQNPFHRAYAAKLAQYLLDLIPPQVAERYGLPRSRITFDDDLDILSKAPDQPDRKPQATLIDDQHEVREPVTILNKVMPKYTEIARINQLQGAVVLGAYINPNGGISGIRVARGLPDGLTWRAILAMRLVRFKPASLNGTPIRTREFIEFNFNLD